MMRYIFVILIALLLLLIFIFFMVRRKKNKKQTLVASKGNAEFTDEFKKLVGNVDLTLKDNHLDVSALEDIEETLRALKELYEKAYISQDEYQTRTEAIMQSLDHKNGS